MFSFVFAVVAQLVEHSIGNGEVSGSIPDNGSVIKNIRPSGSDTYDCVVNMVHTFCFFFSFDATLFFGGSAW